MMQNLIPCIGPCFSNIQSFNESCVARLCPAESRAESRPNPPVGKETRGSGAGHGFDWGEAAKMQEAILLGRVFEQDGRR